MKSIKAVRCRCCLPREAAARLANAKPRFRSRPAHRRISARSRPLLVAPGFSRNRGQRKRSQCGSARCAGAFFLADLIIRQHNDRWLADLLRGSSAPRFPQAVTALARAVKANDAGDYDVSRQQADLAEKLFRASGNTAGVLRAQFEQTFAAQMTRRSEDCRRQATTAERNPRRYSYPWLQIQLGLEKAIVPRLMGDLGADERAARLGHGPGTAESGYGALICAPSGFLAEISVKPATRPRRLETHQRWFGRLLVGAISRHAGLQHVHRVALHGRGCGPPALADGVWREAAALIDPTENLAASRHGPQYHGGCGDRGPSAELAEQQYAEAARDF